MKQIDGLSFFFPAYNEEANINSTVKKALEYLPVVANNFEVIVVDDGSKDNTQNLVSQIIKTNKNVRLIRHPVNKGYGGALTSGWYQSKYSWIAFNDSDGQFDIRQLDRMLKYVGEADLIIGFRENRKDPLIRKLNAKAWGMLNKILFGLNVKDIDCAFKLIKKDVFEKVDRLETSGAFISSELLIKAKKAGFKIVEVPVTHYPRTGGRQTGASFKVILRAFKELILMYPKLVGSK
ncbi:MAG TPA: glycosyltransferase family 2 protein [Patescibacteria group bacterium]